MEEEQIKWPSERIPQGGLFHAPKIKYSKETSDLIKLLMEEARLSMKVRKQIDYHLRNGEPIQPLTAPKTIKNMDSQQAAFHIMRNARLAKRKSLKAIVASGAYDVPVFRPMPDCKIPSSAAKIKLQEKMSGVRLGDLNMKPKRRYVETEYSEEPEDLINDLVEQINERADWLAEMEELGEGKKYRDEIRIQIADRLRRIKMLERKIELRDQGCRIVN